MLAKQPRNTCIFFFCILLLRLIPVFAIYFISRSSHISWGDLDPLLYLGGAQDMLTKGINPFAWFAPLNFHFIAAFLHLAGGNVLGPLCATVVTGWLAVIGLYLFANLLFNRRVALLSAGIAGLYPNFIYYGARLYPESLALCFILFSLYLLIKYAEDTQLHLLLLSGILWGLASQTRGGIHFFSLFIVAFLTWKHYRRGFSFFLKQTVVFFLATYLTMYTIGLFAAPFQGGISLNSGSGLGSVILSVNKISNCCTNYGSIRGNLLYEINLAGESWPEGSMLDMDILELPTIQIAGHVFKFIADDPLAYLKNGLERIGYLWAPNQNLISFLKHQFYHRFGFLTDAVCILISVYYVMVVCCGVWGVALSKDRFKPVFLLFLLFYCTMIFFSSGNSKLRFPMMPFIIMYAVYFVYLLFTEKRVFKKAVASVSATAVIIVFLCNSMFKFGEILLSPAEVKVRQIEMSNELGFPKTARYLLDKYKSFPFYSANHKKRLDAARATAREIIESKESTGQ